MAWNCGECSTRWRVSMRLGSGRLRLLLWEEDFGSCWVRRWVDIMATEGGCWKGWRVRCEDVRARLGPRYGRERGEITEYTEPREITESLVIGPIRRPVE